MYGTEWSNSETEVATSLAHGNITISEGVSQLKKLGSEKSEFALESKARRLRRRLDKPITESVMPTEVKKEDPLADKIHKRLKSGKANLIDLADNCDVSPKIINAAIESLKDKFISVQSDGLWVWIGEPERGKVTTAHQIDMSAYYGKPIRFGVVSDEHLCSRYERLDVLNGVFDVFEKEGVKTVYSCGNYIDGEARFNKNDLHVHGMGNQFRYLMKEYPKRDGITTNFISGDDHEGWYVQREGVDLGRMFASYTDQFDRPDMVHLGYMEHDVIVPCDKGSGRIRMVHPGGGSAFCISYTAQRLAESLTGGEKPNIMLMGHYHKAEYLYYRNIHILQCGTTMDQSPFMRKKRLSAHLGGWIVDATFAPDGSVRRFRTEFINFFDRDFHLQEWRYKQNDSNS